MAAVSSETAAKALPPTAARVAAKPEGFVELNAALSWDCTVASAEVADADGVTI